MTEKIAESVPIIIIRALAIAALLALCWAIWTYLPPLIEGTVLGEVWLIVVTAAIVLALSAAGWALEKMQGG